MSGKPDPFWNMLLVASAETVETSLPEDPHSARILFRAIEVERKKIRGA